MEKQCQTWQVHVEDAMDHSKRIKLITDIENSQR